jgi:hypothetical protein
MILLNCQTQWVNEMRNPLGCRRIYSVKPFPTPLLWLAHPSVEVTSDVECDIPIGRSSDPPRGRYPFGISRIEPRGFGRCRWIPFRLPRRVAPWLETSFYFLLQKPSESTGLNLYHNIKISLPSMIHGRLRASSRCPVFIMQHL